MEYMIGNSEKNDTW